MLYGGKNPSGKLAETWPLRIEDNPSYLNFPGLSYTNFTYSDMQLDKTEIADTDTLTVRCKIRNTGCCAGAEAVQLYIRDVQSTAPRPVRELKGFEKIFLQPGEEKTVLFTLDKRSFAYYEPKLHDCS